MNTRINRTWLPLSTMGAVVLVAGLAMPATGQDTGPDNAPQGQEAEQRPAQLPPDSRRPPEMRQRQVPPAQPSTGQRSQNRSQRPETGRGDHGVDPSMLLIRHPNEIPRMPLPLNSAWRQRLPVYDRTMMDALIGHAPPELTHDLVWHGSGAGQSWLRLRDRIVVVQSWTSANSAGQQAMEDAVAALKDLPASDMLLLLVHTPEGHEGAARYASVAEADNIAMVVDRSGAWCDEVGIHRTPVNFVMDRNGEVRYAGLNAESLPKAVESLLLDTFEEGERALRPLPSRQNRLIVNWPSVRGNPGSTPDIHGRIGPDVYVTEWFNDPPASLRNKVIKVEFWRTNCPHCIRAIPKINESAQRFKDDLAIVAITQESRNALQQGLTSRNVQPDSLHYPIAIDPGGRTARAVGVRGVPHAIIMSSDGVVRWQGNPHGLDDSVIEQIIFANSALVTRGMVDERRWVKN